MEVVEPGLSVGQTKKGETLMSVTKKMHLIGLLCIAWLFI